LKERRDDKHIDTDYKLNCRQYVCTKFTKKQTNKQTNKKERESLSQAYLGLPSPWIRQQKWHWNLSIASPFPKEHCNSKSSLALTHHKCEVLPVCSSGSKRKMNKKQEWDDSNRKTPKGFARDLAVVTLSTTNPTWIGSESNAVLRGLKIKIYLIYI